MSVKPIFYKTLLSSAIVASLTACGGGTQDTTPAADNDPTTPSGSGTDNAAAYSSIFSTRAISDAITEQCGTLGGQEIHSGFDRNDNKVLDDDEIDKTFVVCNGATGAQGAQGLQGEQGAPGVAGEPGAIGQDAQITTAVLDGSTPECANVGGFKLTVNGENHLLCNANAAVAPARNYAEARNMVNGMSTWIANLEDLDQQVQTLDKQMQQIEALYQGTNDSGIKASIESLAKTLQFMIIVAEDKEDGTYSVAELLLETEEVGDNYFAGGEGSVTKAGGILSLSSDFALTRTLEDDSTVSTAIAMDSVTIPPVESSVFELALNNVSAITAGYSEMKVKQVSAKLAMENTVNRSSDEDQDTGDMTFNLVLGTEAEPLHFETVLRDDQVTSDITFDGSLMVTDLKMVEKGFGDFTETEMASGKLNFTGLLAYDGQSIGVNLGLELLKNKSFNYEDFADVLGGLDTGDGSTLEGVVTVSAMDMTADYQEWDESVLNATRYEFDVNDGFSTTVDIWSDGSAYYYKGDTDQYYSPWDYWSFSSSEADIMQSVLNDVVGYGYYDTQGQYYELHGMSLYANEEFGTATGAVYLEGDLDLAQGLPVAGEVLSYDLYLWDVGYDTNSLRNTFESNSQYNVSAGLTLNGISDGQGGVLPEAKLKIDAQRWGAQSRSGDLTFTLSYQNQTFTAKYKHYDPTQRDYANSFNEEIGRSDPLKFTFSDNQGGLLVMDDFAEVAQDYTNPSTLLNCDDDYYYPDTTDSACALGTRSFKIYYNGLNHGKVLNNYYTGDWTATYYDGVEEMVYQYKD